MNLTNIPGWLECVSRKNDDIDTEMISVKDKDRKQTP